MAMKDFQPEEMLTASDVNVYLVNTLGAFKASGSSVVNSTTLVNDPHLSVAVAGNSVYELSGMLKYTSASSTPGLKVQFAGPSGASLSWSVLGLAVGATTQSDVATIPGSISGTISVGTINGVTAYAQVYGCLKTATAGGTFRLMFAQQTSAPNQTSLEPDSYFVLRRIS